MQRISSDVRKHTWQLFIDADMAAAAASVANEVVGRLWNEERFKTALELAVKQSQYPQLLRNRPRSVAGGNAGLAILCSALDTCFPDENWDEFGHKQLQIVVQALETSTMRGSNLSLFSGLSGAAFATWLLSRQGTRYQKLLANIEHYLFPSVKVYAEQILVERPHGCSDALYDVISGLSGMGTYLLSRLGEAMAVDALQAVLSSLVYLTEMAEDGLPHWHVPPHLVPQEHWQRQYPGGYLNCGLAHGIPGPLALLAQAFRSGVQVQGSEEAIVRVADWLVAHHVEDSWGINWPDACSLKEVRTMEQGSRGGRAAWCYGTPGVARTLWLAGEALDRTTYREMALAGMQASYQRPPLASGIGSACLCHGIAGLLQVTLRFANDTGNAVFSEAAQALTGQLLGLYEKESVLGYRNLESEGVLVDHPWLLDGAAGVALALLAASTPCEPVWDRLFLLS